ncbi:unnamed protein product [Mycena citricolor]|uniref:3-oxo-5-alpha-steroid 4-dehydrogenase C-terminal domain-containing protein n=1 Tax=Mycena citricolor TaxID=2018698 RepID=A0AAD2Q0V9_9AGAR|nr:unnamed protein product [Mycena citricolor]
MDRSQLLYDGARRWFTLCNFCAAPISFFIDAPFGRFTPAQKSIFLVDGIKAWICMELVSPIFFTYVFGIAPLGGGGWRDFRFWSPQGVLVGAYYVHYLNRSLLSPLRTPSRSKSHIITPLCAIAFNIVNGSLLGAYLSSPKSGLPSDFSATSFWVGMGLCIAGFVGNVVHDEILLQIRRNAKSKGKAKELPGEEGKEHYSIPHGLLYRYISYPNYFCEWVEWFGFALAADPRLPHALLGGTVSLGNLMAGPASSFFPLLTPPWMFFIIEVAVMFPRAYRGHRWYHDRFGKSYPKERKIAFPFLL